MKSKDLKLSYYCHFAQLTSVGIWFFPTSCPSAASMSMYNDYVISELLLLYSKSTMTESLLSR